MGLPTDGFFGFEFQPPEGAADDKIGLYGVEFEQTPKIALEPFIGFKGFDFSPQLYVLTLQATDQIGIATNMQLSNLVVNVDGRTVEIPGTYDYNTPFELNVPGAWVDDPLSAVVTISGIREAEFSNGQVYSENFVDIPVTISP